jgi:heme exporter protein B
MSKSVWALFYKDILLEFRQKHSFYGVLLYIASTIFVLYLALSDVPESSVWNTLFWITQLFIGINAVAKSFLQESKGRQLYYYSITSPTSFIAAKLIFNTLFMLLMSLISLFLFGVFLGFPVSDGLIFIGIVCLGGMGISLVFSLMSAIAAKAQQNAALMAILGFPVIIPQLLLLIRLSRTAFAEVFREGAVMQLAGLTLIFNVLVVALSLILYPYLWRE